MGFLASGPGSDATVIKKLIAEVFIGVKNQKQIEERRPAFFAKLKELGVVARPLVLGKEQIVFHEEIGVIVDGYNFKFGG